MNLWEEKNSTEPKTNCLNNVENVMNDIITGTKSESNDKNLNDITKKEWKRNCPKCHREITYKNKYKCKYADRDGILCNSCCQLGILVGRKLSNNQIELLKQRTGKNNPMFGKRLSESTKQKMSISHKLIPGKPHTEQSKQKLRIIRSNWILSNHGGPQYNTDACKYFDSLNEQNGWHLRHALNGGEYYIKELGYWVDGYDVDKNIVVEYDEPKHYDVFNKLKEKDIKRQQLIISHLKCRFFRFNERTNMIYEINSTKC